MAARAHVVNRQGVHQVTVSSRGSSRSIEILPKASGTGSSVNSGELLFLALATCYYNDLYREAAKRGMIVEDVAVEGEFGSEREPASSITYHARMTAKADEAAIDDVIWHTDTVAEIYNSLRRSTPVRFDRIEAIRGG